MTFPPEDHSYLPLTESGAVVDFVAAGTFAHRLPTAVHTHLLQKQHDTNTETIENISETVS